MNLILTIKKILIDNWQTILLLIFSADKRKINKSDAKLLLKDASAAVMEGATGAIQIGLIAKMFSLGAIIGGIVCTVITFFICWLYYH